MTHAPGEERLSAQAEKAWTAFEALQEELSVETRLLHAAEKRYESAEAALAECMESNTQHYIALGKAEQRVQEAEGEIESMGEQMYLMEQQRVALTPPPPAPRETKETP